MTQERLDIVLKLQATGEDITLWSRSERFDDYVQGFYVRVKIDKKDTWGIGRIEGVRLGAPYQLGSSTTKDQTKYLLVYRPPGAPLVVSINDVSNDPIAMEELESWDANLAILQLSLAHKLDVEAAKCKREDMGTTERVVVKLRKNISPKHLDAHKRISLDDRKSGGKILDSIAMFERKAVEHSSHSIQKRAALIKASQGIPEKSPRGSSTDSQLPPSIPALREKSKENSPESPTNSPLKTATPKSPTQKPSEKSSNQTPPPSDITLSREIKLDSLELTIEESSESFESRRSIFGASITKQDPKPDSKSDPKPDTKPDPKPDSKPDSKSDQKESKSERKDDSKPKEIISESKSDSLSEPQKISEKAQDSPSPAPVHAKEPEIQISQPQTPVENFPVESKPAPEITEDGGLPKKDSPKKSESPKTLKKTEKTQSATSPSTPDANSEPIKSPKSPKAGNSSRTTPRSPRTGKAVDPLKTTKEDVLPPSSPKKQGSSFSLDSPSASEKHLDSEQPRTTPQRARAKSVENKHSIEIRERESKSSQNPNRPRSIELSDPITEEPTSNHPPGNSHSHESSKKGKSSKDKSDHHSPVSPPHSSSSQDHIEIPSSKISQGTSPSNPKKKGKKLESVTKKISQLTSAPNSSRPASSESVEFSGFTKQKSSEPKSPEQKTKKGSFLSKRFMKSRHEKSDRSKSNSNDELTGNSPTNTPVSITSSGEETCGISLGHIPYADEPDDEFLTDDDHPQSPKQESRRSHSKSETLNQSPGGSGENLIQSSTKDNPLFSDQKKSSSERITVGAEKTAPPNLENSDHSGSGIKSGGGGGSQIPSHRSHKRTSSLELTTTTYPVENLTGRDHRSGTVVLLGAPLLSRFSIPVSLLPDARDWEAKKMRSIEKQSRLHDKEKTALLLEESAFREKFPLDSKEKFAVLDREQFAERETMNRKIIQDKLNLQEQQQQEKRSLDRILKKARQQATLELTQEHDKTEKRTNADFEKQILNLKKAGRVDRAGDELLERLQQAHKAHLVRNHHTKELAELKLLHKHELETLKKRQELVKRHTQAAQKLERDILIRQLSLSQKLLRQKRWLSLDLLREEQNTLRSFQERRHQLEIRQEGDTQQLALKLIQKQQLLESSNLSKNHLSAKKKESEQFQKSKRALKTSHLHAIRKAQKDKSLHKDDLKSKLDDLQIKYKSELDQLVAQHAPQHGSPDSGSIPVEKIAARHEEQLEWFAEERKRRRDLILLHHQTDKNALQEEIELARKALESQLKSSIAEFQQEEITMKETFTVANENSLWELQQLHWREIQETQKSAHDQQQNVLGRMQEELKATPYVNEEERTQAEEQMNVEQLELEQQHEQEMLILEQERVQEQEQLKVQLEEEKKEVMSVRIVEDELTLRQEYIRKIALDTGLSEELIAKQLDIIGMPSFMY